MSTPEPTSIDTEQILPMVSRPDPAILEAERQQLRELTSRPAPRRAWGYLRLSGPGWLQGAITLGGGSAASSLIAGTLTGYKFLWVQPVAMFFGIVMLGALAHQTLSTRMRPFEAVGRYVHPLMAWAWALTSLISSMVWALPQYSLSVNVVEDMGGLAGWKVNPLPVVIVILAITGFVTWNYSKSTRWVKLFEHILRFMVAGILVCFLLVVLRTDIPWGDVVKGYNPFSSANWPQNVKELDVLIAAFATAVGINMTFLFPYSLLARGWGREHRGLARFDLATGLLIPFVIATSLIIIVAANFHNPDDPKAMQSAIQLANLLNPALGPFYSHIVFGLGILGMAVSTIICLMLVSGFIVAELFGGGKKMYHVGSLLPAVGILGPMVWDQHKFWMAIPTSVICFFFIAIAYVSFLVLNNRKAYLGGDRPEGWRRVVWNCLLGAATVVVGSTAIFKAVQMVRDFVSKLFG
jgi:manganese transport protein